MSLKIGIVGLPNVGKSTLFNALTRSKGAEAQNYPFCTIDPNVGIVEVPDDRLQNLSKISGSQKIIPAAIEFVDIAGLVKGASQGEGLGNKFLSHIRECNAIAHVLRGFDDENVTHVHGKVDPKEDREVIESELLLADMQTVGKRLEKAASEIKSGNKEKQIYHALIERLYGEIQAGKLVSTIDFTDEEKEMLKDLHLLTAKPLLYVFNLHEDQILGVDRNKYAEALQVDPDMIIPISAKIEEDLIDFSEQEAQEYLKDLGIENTGLSTLIRSAYKKLGLHTYFTSGEKETRAWTFKTGTLAPQAAGIIHTDFEKGFIKAEVIDYADYAEHGGATKAREVGKARIEGKDYVVKDGDVIHFRFS